MEHNNVSLPESIDEAASVLAKFVIPLYESDIRGRPSPHGSGFLIQTNGHHFLFSAAHVLETLTNKPLFHYATPNLTRTLSGRVLLNPWQGDRERDPIDVGILHLSGEGLPPYPEVTEPTTK